MKKMVFMGLLVSITSFCWSQDIDKIIHAQEVERLERILSSDDMQGRRTFSPGIDKAASFIADEFKKAGLQPGAGSSYFQEFTLFRTKFISASGEINGVTVDSRNVVGLTTKPAISITESSGYDLFVIGPKDTLMPAIRRMQANKKNYFVAVDTTHRRLFNSLKSSRREMFPSDNSIILILSSEAVNSYKAEFKQDLTEMKLMNVVGILPGKKKKEEYVIFSGHYDHLGTGRPNKEADSVFNGANDDAAGTTAVMMLAHYFARKKDNERTLVFAAFTAEEIGGYGSQYFSRQFNPDKVIAMFNIEMIGTESKWGTGSAYITGYEKTDMGKILEKNLEGTHFTFYPDPYKTQNLFYRSDNATLARLGVPAHTISTSRMEADTMAVNKTIDKYYHSLDDEIETLDMKNMAEIIKAIAISATSIIAGKDTPGRVNTKDLR